MNYEYAEKVLEVMKPQVMVPKSIYIIYLFN